MEIEVAIKKTIEYATKFRSHVNIKEISQRLISTKKFSEEEVVGVLKKMQWQNKRNKWYQNKIKLAEELAKKIKKEFKEIYFIGVTGSVASGHPKKEDDVDILLITKKDELWKNRLKLRLWTKLNQIPYRDRLGRKKDNCFCFNLWLDESGLRIPPEKQNLRNAVDLVLMKPLINRNKTYEKFLKENFWVKKYLASGYDGLIKKYQLKKIKIKKITKDKTLNKFYFWPQYLYMKPKITGEKVGLHQAFFHKSDGKIES